MLSIITTIFRNVRSQFVYLLISTLVWYLRKFAKKCFQPFVGHVLDDGRLEHHGLQGGQMAQLYSTPSGLRAASNSNSPGNLQGQQSTLLVVPQPINATKMSSGLANGTGRKYQCKMCPQVRFKSRKKGSLDIRLLALR